MRFTNSNQPHSRHSWLARCALTALLCHAGIACMADERWPYAGLRSAQVDRAAPDETLPPQDHATTSSTPDPCEPPIVDVPQAMLSVDVHPVNQPGQIELDPNSLPTECPAPVLAGVAPIYVGFQPASCAGWPIWPGAQFCHRPLYFEEPCVERYGYTQCCQPVCSAAHFFGTVAILPLKFWQQCPGSCVATPPAF